ncbi:hypothetical protein [Mucilaginibacter lappiensis]|jgi:hypothetical protein|uniref:hypothetical protein n=1 Tax=Mucilaginibacter lappiensis TaxID=354630 RepID=UPI003D1C8E0B
MTKQLFSLIFLLVCLFNLSCNKDHSSKPVVTEPQKLYNIHFTASGVSKLPQSLTDKKLAVNGLKTNVIDINSGYLKTLYYAVYDVNGVQVHALSQDSTTANFGSFTDKLPAGNYKVSVAAGMSGLAFKIGYRHDEPVIYYNDLYVDSPLPGPFGWKDTFYSNFSLVVGNTDINQSVNLTRLIAQLQVNIEDPLPATAKKIVISTGTDYERCFLRFDTGVPVEYDGIKNISDITTIAGSAIGTTNYKISKNVLTMGKPFTITITCYDANSKILGQVAVGDVVFQRNTITLLSGKLFGGGSPGNVTLNTQWNVTPITIHF